MYTPETTCMKGISVDIMDVWIKQLCNHKVWDFAMAFWDRKVSGTFEKRTTGAPFVIVSVTLRTRSTSKSKDVLVLILTQKEVRSVSFLNIFYCSNFKTIKISILSQQTKDSFSEQVRVTTGKFQTGAPSKSHLFCTVKFTNPTSQM